MSAETERSSTESSAASGLDFEDTALTLTLRLPGDPDRKRGASSSSCCSLADRSSLLAEAPPAPGLAAGEVVPQERARERRRRVHQGGLRAGQVRQGGRRRRALPAQGEPAGLCRLRPAPPRAPGQVLLPLHQKFANDEMKLVDAVNGTEYVPTYEDKDGDWMLVGDVPWKMFEEACQRVRLMKNSEAVNIAPRAAR
ncbi:unnamed protein product [Triticum turgidum subsp. durum]|uniref:Auxin-responsive protein n=1 Tax=Triticum turgidum subsp. durum TaxID=4567 RepID=A0A9R0RDY6_TRITD|nr:unnamed protein product [Triticum turgidum subsp. durum]